MPTELHGKRIAILAADGGSVSAGDEAIGRRQPAETPRADREEETPS